MIRRLLLMLRRRRDGVGTELTEQVTALKLRTDAAVAHADSQVRRTRMLDSYESAGRVLGERRSP